MAHLSNSTTTGFSSFTEKLKLFVDGSIASFSIISSDENPFTNFGKPGLNDVLVADILSKLILSIASINESDIIEVFPLESILVVILSVALVVVSVRFIKVSFSVITAGKLGDSPLDVVMSIFVKEVRLLSFSFSSVLSRGEFENSSSDWTADIWFIEGVMRSEVSVISDNASCIAIWKEQGKCLHQEWIVWKMKGSKLEIHLKLTEKAKCETS